MIYAYENIATTTIKLFTFCVLDFLIQDISPISDILRGDRFIITARSCGKQELLGCHIDAITPTSGTVEVTTPQTLLGYNPRSYYLIDLFSF